MAELPTAESIAPAPRVLVVDDSRDILEPLAEYLGAQGLDVVTAADGMGMRRQLAAGRIDLVVLDVMLPDESGWTLCAEVVDRFGIPVIMLTAVAEVQQRIHGLGLGADDYVTKPFAPGELLARIRTVLRRAMRQQTRAAGQAAASSEAPAASAPATAAALDPAALAGRYLFDGWLFDTRRYELHDPAGQPLELNTAEFKLLCALVAHPNQVLGRDRLLQLTHGSDTPQVFDRSIDTVVSRLRRKLETRTDGQRLIKTAWGNGYVFAVDVQEASTT